jgi:DNA processing protein
MGHREQLIKDYLHLSSLNIIGRMRHDILVQNFGSVSAALSASKNQLCACHGINETMAEKILSPRNEAQLQKDFELWKDNQIKIVLIIDEDYPENLKQNSDAPIMLQIKGDYLKNDQCALAIVGSRKCSKYGAEMAYEFGKALAERGFTIISGMARGIDSAAHRGCLDAGQRSIAVQACGLSQIYPPSGRHLAKDIVANGCLISEMAWGMPPLRQNFPRRNRIVSGLALGTVVIEAAEKSGSLITARWAMEQNREVFALPGQINNPLSLGCHKLIQDGAKLITSIEDILDEFPALTVNQPAEEQSRLSFPDLSPQQTAVLSVFNEAENNEEISFNHLQLKTQFNHSDLSLTLFKLENLQLIKALPQKSYRLSGARLLG